MLCGHEINKSAVSVLWVFHTNEETCAIRDKLSGLLSGNEKESNDRFDLGWNWRCQDSVSATQNEHESQYKSQRGSDF